jgi:phage-related protein (TIGR01555 family)
MELAKSMINAVLIDEGDEYERENPNFGNMPELLEMFMYDVSSAVDMPVTRLFGRSPQGMNATGESDREQWHETVEDDRERQRPRWHQLVTVLLAAKEGPAKGAEPDGWRVTFKPLEQLSEKEWAEVRKLQADADKAYVEAEILLPSEVASSRFRAEGWSSETKIDLETREALREAELEALQDRIENPPEKQALEMKAQAQEAKQAKPGQSAAKKPKPAK